MADIVVIFRIQTESRNMNQLPIIENKTILTPTSGFLDSGFTHTLNAYSGCSHSNSLCGLYCYAQHNHWITKGRSWKLYGAKKNIVDAYRRDYDRIKRPRRGEPKQLRIYMSSSTDPYVPQEKAARITQTLLNEMITRPPDVLVIQTHSTLVERDLQLIYGLSAQTTVFVSVTVETDMEQIPGFPPHVYKPSERIATIGRFHELGIKTRTTVSPLCPLEDPVRFANSLAAVSDQVVLDHYLLGDGSNGRRTKRTDFPAMLDSAGFGKWNSLDTFWEVIDVFRSEIGTERVSVSADGFNQLTQLHGTTSRDSK